MIDDNMAIYSISTVAELIGLHPETLRVWERNGLIKPDRSSYQRKYTNNDLLRLQFIRFLIEEKGFNVASLSHLIQMYPCWYRVACIGGKKNSRHINPSRPCWKRQGTFCFKVQDNADLCCCKIKNQED